jgi:hypothetical protein
MKLDITALRATAMMMWLAVLIPAVFWCSDVGADQDIEETASDQAEGVWMKTEPDPLAQSRTFEEELKDLLSWRPYVYESMGRRDPFGPLVTGEEMEDSGGSHLPDPRGLVLVGVLWGEKDRFALAEDWGGRSYVLREGDPVWNGHVVRVEQRKVVIRYNHFGMWKTITLPMKTGKETFNAKER